MTTLAAAPRRRLRLALGAAAVAAALVGAPAALGAKAAPVTITMGKGTMFQTSVSPASAKAGKIAFTLVNRGDMRHEAVIIRTNPRYDRLPVKDSVASEKGRVGKIPNVAGGTSKKLTLTLAAGRYVIICNLPGHYQAGMRVAFSVRR